MTDLGLLLGRICLALIFVISGPGKLLGAATFAASLATKGFPAPLAFAYAVAVLELIGGLMVLAGFKTRCAALALFAFTAGTILISHNFWAFEGARYAAQQTQALKNLSMMGGFLVLAAAGPGLWSLDARLRGRKRYG